MDKETLSNYGWIVICVLVLAVMLALATPFGKFISNAVQNTTQGLFDVNQNALNVAGVPGLTIENQEFDISDGNESKNKILISWNTMEVTGQSEVIMNDIPFTKVSDKTLTVEELLKTEIKATLNAETNIVSCTMAQEAGDGIIIAEYDGLPCIIVTKVCEFEGITFAKTGFYTLDFGTEEIDADFVIQYACLHESTEIVNIEPTCVKNGMENAEICTICGKTTVPGNTIAATGHQNTVVKNAKEATCLESGYTGDTICSDCDMVIKGRTIAVKKHTTTIINVTNTYTGDTKCTTCNTIVTEGHAIPDGPNTFVKKTWNGFQPTDGQFIWTDGKSVYYSEDDKQYVLNGDTWEPKTWNGLTSFKGTCVWTDGENVYFSSSSEGNYVLDGNTWKSKSWNKYIISGMDIWTDGTNTYYSYSDNKYVLKNGKWENITMASPTYTNGSSIWTDGKNSYFSSYERQYVLNGNTWVNKEWNGYSRLYGGNIWTDGTNYYFSDNSKQYVLYNGDWVEKPWNGLTYFSGYKIWTDGTNVYYSSGSSQYVLSK